MGYLTHLLSYEFVSKRVDMAWSEVLNAIEKQFASRQFAIEYAMAELLLVDEYPQALLELASLDKGDDIHPYIDELAAMEPVLPEKECSDKLLYLVLAWLHEHIENYPDPLGVIEEVYADFDYPEQISGFVRYMPLEEPDLGSVEKNNARLYEKWKLYLMSCSHYQRKEGAGQLFNEAFPNPLNNRVL